MQRGDDLHDFEQRADIVAVVQSAQPVLEMIQEDREHAFLVFRPILSHVVRRQLEPFAEALAVARQPWPGKQASERALADRYRIQDAQTFRSLFEMAKRGLLKAKVEKAYPLSEVKAAVQHAAQGKRRGKIIFEFPV